MTENAENESPVSKTRRKKDMHALQELGEALVALSGAQLAALELPERLLDALVEARRVSSFEAKRRQLQYIGRLMREVDAGAIAHHLARLKGERQRENSGHHELERWRERLLADDSALTELVEAAPGCDPQLLRTLVRNARREQAAGRPPKSSRALFRLLREMFDTAQPAGHGEPQ